MSQTEVQLVKGLNLDPAAPADATKVDSTGRFLVGASSATNNSIAEFSKSVGSGAAGCHITVENTATDSVNNNASIQLKTDQGIARLYAYRANETYLQSRVSGTSDLILQANGSSNLRLETGNTERARIDSSGRLLVGTSTARSNVKFGSTSTTPAVQFETATNSWNNGLSIINNSGSGYAPSLRLGLTGGSSVGSNTLVGEQQLGKISFHGADGTDIREAATISGNVDATPGSADMPGRLVFSTTKDGASSPTEAFRVNRFQELVFSDSSVSWNIKSARPSGTGQGHIIFTNGGSSVGSITTTPTATGFNTSSDYRLKENVVDLDGAITRVKQLAPKRFNFIVDADTTVDGFLAHEAQAVVPEAVTGTQDEVDGEGNPVYQGIDQSKLVPLLTAALQEAIGKIETLETANASQAATIAALDARLTALEGAG